MTPGNVCAWAGLSRRTCCRRMACVGQGVCRQLHWVAIASRGQLPWGRPSGRTAPVGRGPFAACQCQGWFPAGLDFMWCVSLGCQFAQSACSAPGARQMYEPAKGAPSSSRAACAGPVTRDAVMGVVGQHRTCMLQSFVAASGRCDTRLHGAVAACIGRAPASCRPAAGLCSGCT